MNLNAFLLALAMVESGNDANAVGKAGERTQWQITPSVWRKYAKMPMAVAEPWQTRAVAIKHIQAIQKSLPVEMAKSPFWVAVQWNGGPGAIRRSKHVAAHVPRRTRDFADRVRALYYVYEKDPRCMR